MKGINVISNKFLSIMLVVTILIIYSFVVPLNKSHAATYNQVIINANKNNNNGIDAFPESYRVLLNKLVQQTGHTNWKFKAFYTDIDWNELISGKNENACLRSTIHKDNPSNWFCSASFEAHVKKNENYGKDGFYCASPSLVNYFIDPRNFLTETTIFQFLNIGFEASETPDIIQESLNGTFMEGTAQNGERYANIIYDAAKASGESATSLVTKIFQELGKGSPGNPPHMVSGNDTTYPNTYNFFNYGATDGGGAQLRGLAYADSKGWHDPRTALVEGAKLVAGSYTSQGQNTKYLYKFDVVGSEPGDLYWHQYMTNLQDPTNQAKMMYDEYVNNGQLNNDFVYVITVYKNMTTYNKKPSSLTGSELYYVSSNYSTVGVRNGVGTNNGEIARLGKDTLVTMVQLNAGVSDGIQWHKIRLEDGREGYMSSEYLTKVNNIVDSYNVPSQPAEETPQPPITPTDKTGDIDGNGVTDAMDMYLMIEHMLGNSVLTEEKFNIADMDSNSIIDAMDLYLLIEKIRN